MQSLCLFPHWNVFCLFFPPHLKRGYLTRQCTNIRTGVTCVIGTLLQPLAHLADTKPIHYLDRTQSKKIIPRGMYGAAKRLRTQCLLQTHASGLSVWRWTSTSAECVTRGVGHTRAMFRHNRGHIAFSQPRASLAIVWMRCGAWICWCWCGSGTWIRWNIHGCIRTKQRYTIRHTPIWCRANSPYSTSCGM